MDDENARVRVEVSEDAASTPVTHRPVTHHPDGWGVRAVVRAALELHARIPPASLHTVLGVVPDPAGAFASYPYPWLRDAGFKVPDTFSNTSGDSRAGSMRTGPTDAGRAEHEATTLTLSRGLLQRQLADVTRDGARKGRRQDDHRGRVLLEAREHPVLRQGRLVRGRRVLLRSRDVCARLWQRVQPRRLHLWVELKGEAVRGHVDATVAIRAGPRAPHCDRGRV